MTDMTGSSASPVPDVISENASLLEPGSKVTLLIIDADDFGGGVHYLHYCFNPHTPEEIESANGDESLLGPKPVFFGGRQFEYWPFSISGMSMTTGQAAEPTLTVANLDGVATALNLAYNDMRNAKVNVIETYAKYLDAENYGGVNPDADPTAFSRQVWWINYKQSSDYETCVYSLNSPADVNGIQIPTRIITNLCTWAQRGLYRSGDGCSYSGSAYFDIDGNEVSDPSLDVCSGLMEHCTKRFGYGLAEPKSAPIDFGGFPGAQLIQGQ
ncbi:MAG: hypothetical protein [Bacteriophage sp.]|nr:MAG: hypothetical protein [Bacteriophage sp.]